MSDTPKVLNPYPEIWLQVGEIETDMDIREIYREGDITWCQDQQFDTDVRYVLASARDAEVDALRHAVEHAEYLARAVENFQRCLNKKNWCTSTEEEHDAALEEFSESWRVVTRCIYEFRKCAAKALGE